ncbi:MAG: hypothetical protein MZW92_04380 [Comamonadaceae bacterium]|nr:hypothetical protein [Comamonadaceae bacterium]
MVYGVVGLKTHAKMLLVLRRESEPPGRRAARARSLVPYAHLGTGNYHPTHHQAVHRLRHAHRRRRRSAPTSSEVFMHLTSLAKVEKLTHLWLAPFTLHKRVLAAIASEAKHRARRASRAGIDRQDERAWSKRPRSTRCTRPRRRACRST